MRIIDADALIRRVNENEFYTDKLKRVLCSIVDASPTVDAVPIVHAHWRMYSYDEAICSNCGYDRSTEFESTSEAKERWSELPKFCENCGAKMRDEQEKNCSDCHYATKLKSGAYRCRRKRYDIAAKSCFKPKEGEEGTEQ